VRNGVGEKIAVELLRRSLSAYVVEPYSVGVPPRYYILGGLVFQELTRQYLREWGNNWLKDAPQRLVYYDRFQSELFPEKRKIVFLSQILPTRDTVGYEQISNLDVKRLKGRKILDLAQLAK